MAFGLIYVRQGYPCLPNNSAISHQSKRQYGETYDAKLRYSTRALFESSFSINSTHTFPGFAELDYLLVLQRLVGLITQHR